MKLQVFQQLKNRPCRKLCYLEFSPWCARSKALFSNITGNSFSLGSMVNYYYYHNYGTLVGVFKHKSYLHRHLSNGNVCRTYLQYLHSQRRVTLQYLPSNGRDSARARYICTAGICGGLETVSVAQSRSPQSRNKLRII